MMKLVFMVTDERTFNGYNTYEIKIETMEDVDKAERYIKRRLRKGGLMGTSLYNGSIEHYKNKELMDMLAYIRWLLSDEESEETEVEATEETNDAYTVEPSRTRIETWTRNHEEYVLACIDEDSERIIMVYQTNKITDLEKVKNAIEKEIDERGFILETLRYNRQDITKDGLTKSYSWSDLSLEDYVQSVSEIYEHMTSITIDTSNKGKKGYEKLYIFVAKHLTLNDTYNLSIVPYHREWRYDIPKVDANTLHMLSKIIYHCDSIYPLQPLNDEYICSGDTIQVIIAYLKTE